MLTILNMLQTLCITFFLQYTNIIVHYWKFSTNCWSHWW